MPENGERARPRTEVVAQLVAVQPELEGVVPAAGEVDVLVVGAEILAVSVEVARVAATAQLEPEQCRLAFFQVAILVQLGGVLRVVLDVLDAEARRPVHDHVLLHVLLRECARRQRVRHKNREKFAFHLGPLSQEELAAHRRRVAAVHEVVAVDAAARDERVFGVALFQPPLAS